MPKSGVQKFVIIDGHKGVNKSKRSFSSVLHMKLQKVTRGEGKDEEQILMHLTIPRRCS